MRYRTAFFALATSFALAPAVLADTCPPIPNNSGYFNVYVEYEVYGSSLNAQGIMSDLRQVCNPDVLAGNNYLGTGTRPDTYGLWAMCMAPGRAMDEYFTRPPGLPAYANFCPRNVKPPKSAGKPPSAAPAKAKCSKKDIEGKWQRTSDGTKVGLYGGFGRMVKYFGSINWPMAVGKFYRVKHISGSCDWSARCTTVRMRASSKNYNYSAEPCTLRLSADKNRLTTSDGSGTWTRGWK